MKLLIEPLQFVTNDYTAKEGELVVTAAQKLTLSEYNTAILANLIERDIDLKTAQKYRIKEAAKEKIQSLAWRIERAQEREQTGLAGETLIDVFLEREAIRKASNRIETEIDALTDEAEIRAKILEVTEADYDEPKILTRLAFLRRFTTAERTALRLARDSGQSPELQDWWELIVLSGAVTLTDADTIYGVNALEQQGLLSPGRADEILGG